MARKKKFNNQAGFLWNTDDILKVQKLAEARSLTPSDIYREAMRQYFEVQEGKALLVHPAAAINPAASVQVVPLANTTGPVSLADPAYTLDPTSEPLTTSTQAPSAPTAGA